MYRARYRRIVFFFARVLLNIGFWDIFLPRIGLRGLAMRTRPGRLHRIAAAFRVLAIQMGGVMIKVGQFLSSRVDVLPDEIISELAGLQDEVPPAAFEAIKQVAEADLGEALEEKYLSFDPIPLASASLGQVYRAILRPGTIPDAVEGWGRDPGVLDVVVKIQRPDIDKIIETDLNALYTVGRWLKRYRPISRRADVPTLLAEFSRTLHEEIDYLAEGRNAETFAANFSDQPEVRVPRVVWPCTALRVLTLENVLSIKITDYEAITAAGINRAEVADRLLDTYLQQIFEDGFFHADPHPGNLFVAPLEQHSEDGLKPAWQLTFVDFGMVGRVPPNLRTGLRELLIGVGTQDTVRVIKSYQMMGVLLPGADLELIEKAEATVFDRYWGKNMSELTHIDPQEVHELASEFRELVFSMPFQVPQNLIFLGRAVGILSGMCTGLDPDFNVWDHLAPYAQKLIAQEARSAGKTVLDEATNLFRTAITIPRKVDAVLTRMERGELAVRAPEISRQIRHIEGSIRQVAGGVVFAALLLGGIQLYLAHETVFSDILLAAAGVSLIWTILSGRRRPAY